MRRAHAGLAVALALALAACGGSAPKVVAEERRVVTSGLALLALVPEGADAVLELDVARLRRNEVVGPVVRALSPWLAARTQPEAWPIDLPIAADQLLFAVYGLGDAEAAMLVVVRGAAIDAPVVVASAPELAVLDAHTFVFGPPAPRAAAERLAAGGGTPLADDAALLALRDRAMPLRAPGAALRLTARLSTEARIAVAQRLGYDGAVPATLSVWADVADDFALVADLGADDPGEADRLASDMTRLGERLGNVLDAPILLSKWRAVPRGAAVRLVWTIGPKLLREAVASLPAPGGS